MRVILAASIAGALIGIAVASAQTPSGGSTETEPPSIRDIMAKQQMRHIKLWFAGSAGNWPLADYEVDGLKDGFEAVNEQLGGNTVADAVGAPLAALEKAIDGKQRAAFLSAFDKLTAGCNSCHHTLDHAFIVIRRPALLPYSDQTFAVQ